ncbi:MAG: peptidyl-prolyl cis-trans isomerase [Phycisphaeraceae bacterium]
MLSVRGLSWIVACWLGLLVTGCGGNGGGASLSPGDFSANAGPGGEESVAAQSHAQATRPSRAESPTTDAEAPTEPAITTEQAANPTTADAEATTDEAPTESIADAGQLFLDAMVGQINGKPVYARTIFRSIGEDVLRRLGDNQSRLGFRREAQALIGAEVQSRVVDALILAEAEKDLNEGQHRQLAAYMEKEREMILAQHLGSQALAERAIQQQHGHSLSRELEIRRQRALIDRYRQEKLLPQIVVTRRDVERHYQDNYDQYNEAPTVEVRVILVDDAATADAVETALDSEQPFEQVAQRHSRFRASQGGLMAFELSEGLESFQALRWQEVNEAIRDLEVGQQSQRIEVEGGYAWVKMESLVGGESTGIKEVFLQIEQRLRSSQASQLQQRYIGDLLENGNYTPLEEMANALLDVAMSRYARQN